VNQREREELEAKRAELLAKMAMPTLRDTVVRGLTIGLPAWWRGPGPDEAALGLLYGTGWVLYEPAMAPVQWQFFWLVFGVRLLFADPLRAFPRSITIACGLATALYIAIITGWV
jgi:hypothetical protein